MYDYEIKCDEKEKRESYYIRIYTDEIVMLIDSYGIVCDKFIVRYYPKYRESYNLFMKKLEEHKEQLNINIVMKLLEIYYTKNISESIFTYKEKRKYRKRMSENISLASFF
jgi:hypothetical protein